MDQARLQHMQAHAITGVGGQAWWELFGVALTRLYYPLELIKSRHVAG